MKKLHKALVAGGITLAVLVPAATAFAAGYGPQRDGRGVATCTADQAAERQQLRDGTGWRHTAADGTTVTTPAGAGRQSGAMDGTGPRAERPMDGTGNRWGFQR